MAAAPPRTHRTLESHDLVSYALGFLAPNECYEAAAISKPFARAFQTRTKGMFRIVRRNVGLFRYASRATAMPGGGVVIADYNGGDLKVFSPQGEQVQVLCPFSRDRTDSLQTPAAVAFVGNGTAWVVEAVPSKLVLMRLDETEESRKIKEFNPPGALVYDVAVADDELLVLCSTLGYPFIGKIMVLDKESGEFRREFGHTSEDCAFRGAECMAVDGALVYVAAKYNHAVKIFTHADGVLRKCFGRQGLSDDERRSASPGEFNGPCGIAVGGGQIIVSERAGRRIQVLSLEGEPLQVIRYFEESLEYFGGGLCLEGNRLWCLGPLTDRNHVDVFVRI